MMDAVSQLPWRSRGAAPVIEKDEKLLHASLPHRIKYLPPLCVYVLLLGFCLLLIAIALFLELTSSALAIVLFFVALIIAVMVQHWFFHAILSVSVSDIILTNKRILYLTRILWFNDMSHDVALVKVKAVEVHKRGIVQNALNYGDLWFDTGGSSAEEPHQTIHFVPSPQTWAEEIVSAMRAGGRP